MQQPTNTLCVGNYWPVTNDRVIDIVGGMNATCSSPTLASDRFGVANEAITVTGQSTAWNLPVGHYFQGDTTMTMWVNKVACSNNGPFGNCIYH
jgi:hypothetical protein